jgi:hypothetical protein
MLNPKSIFPTFLYLGKSWTSRRLASVARSNGVSRDGLRLHSVDRKQQNSSSNRTSLGWSGKRNFKEEKGVFGGSDVLHRSLTFSDN